MWKKNSCSRTGANDLDQNTGSPPHPLHTSRTGDQVGTTYRRKTDTIVRSVEVEYVKTELFSPVYLGCSTVTSKLF